MSYGRWSILFIAVLLSGLGTAGAFNYFVDPYQMFHADDIFYQNERFGNPGLARNREYDSIIIGGTMTENFSPSYVDKSFHSNVLKLSVRGATAHEEYLTAKYALSQKKLRFVIWGMDFSSYAGPPEGASEETPLEFYDKSRLNDLWTLFTYDTLDLSVKKVELDRFGIKDTNFIRGIEDNYSWFRGQEDQFNRKSYRRLWEESYKQVRSAPPGKMPDLTAMRESFKKNMLSVVDENPGTTFYVFFPPYSALYYYQYYKASRESFISFLLFKKLACLELLSKPNVKLYDFQENEVITKDIRYYKDLTEFHPEVNSFIIDCLAGGRNTVTRANLNVLLKKQVKSMETLDLEEIFTDNIEDEPGA